MVLEQLCELLGKAAFKHSPDSTNSIESRAMLRFDLEVAHDSPALPQCDDSAWLAALRQEKIGRALQSDLVKTPFDVCNLIELNKILIFSQLLNISPVLP